MVTPLTRIRLNDVCGPTATFGKLIHHRMFTLEPIRFLAMRNQRAEFRMFRSVENGHNDSDQKPTFQHVVARVEEAFLAEQGIESSKYTRHMLACSLHHPFEIYLALLSEEISFLKRHRNELQGVSGLDLLFEEHGSVLEQMSEFRDALLHPVPGKYEQGVKSFVAIGAPMHQLVDYIQLRVDDFIERTRSALRLGIEGLLTDLSDEQAAYCRYLSLRLLDVSDGKELPHVHCNRAVTKSLEEMRSVSSLISLIERSGGQVWQPSEHERAAAERLARALADTFPVRPRLLDDEEPVVAPIKDGVVLGAVEAITKNAPQPLGDATGPHVANAVKNAGGYHGLLFRSLVLFNECAALIDKKGPNPLEWDHRDRILLAGLLRVAHAILVPVFQSYIQGRDRNPSLRIADLDAIVDDDAHLRALVDLRNEVFHTESPLLGPDRVMGNLEDVEFTSRFITASAEFVGRLLVLRKSGDDVQLDAIEDGIA